jgi:hypothetical protein
MNLRRYSDDHKLVTFAKRADIWDFKKQHELFSGQGDALREHSLVLMKFFEQKHSRILDEELERGSYEEALEAFNVDEDEIGDFYMMLVTRDGRVLLDSHEPVEPEQIFRALARYDRETTSGGL